MFLGEENVTIANFSMIAAGLFHDADIDSPGNAVGVSGGPDGQNDGLWCQSSLNQNMIGTWYYPDGTTVPHGSVDGNYNPSPLFANNTPTGQVGLLRNGGIGCIQGLYSCVIPNEKGINQTLYVAVYGNFEFDNGGKFLQFCYIVTIHRHNLNLSQITFKLYLKIIKFVIRLQNCM